MPKLEKGEELPCGCNRMHTGLYVYCIRHLGDKDFRLDKEDNMPKVSELVEAYLELCRGRIHPHVTVLNPTVWKSVLVDLIDRPGRCTAFDPPEGPQWRFNDSIIRWDESEYNFRFEDIRSDLDAS